MQKRFRNKLADETSPYLLQHAHNPVDWYPWGEEAFAKAKAEDKPVIVSIGYSACHWCHVMEHESFEDESAAEIMNEHFVCIKVDMEERPDIDQIYMTFVQITTGRGGWPMNVFVTPDKLPFFGGTYFPPSPRFGMPAWKQVLLSIAEAWRERREDLVGTANEILGELRRVTDTEFAEAGVSAELSDHAFASFVRNFDAKNGGFGGAPKFPPAMSLEFLLRYYKRTGNANALEMAKFTARKMAEGGIYDQLGGGFHRYAVDAIWLVPHFEKMLYDNAQLIRNYLHLYQIATEAGDVADAEFFKRIAVETLEYVRREMLDDSGGFYSSQDADSEGEEGKFFVWEPDEIAEILGSDSPEFAKYFDVTAEGNFEGKNILNIKNGGPMTEPVRDARAKLFAEREKRVKPFRDEKVLAAWNGLMLAAFAEAAVVFGDEEYLSVAKKNAEFLLTEMKKDGRLVRTWKDGRAKLNGYIEDHANVADGLIELFKSTGEVRYVLEAKELAETMIAEFWDGEDGGFFFTSNSHEELIIRNKEFYDNATPSGNSAAADVLLKLARIFGDGRFERFAMTILRLAAGQIKRHPQGFGRSLSTLEFSLSPSKELVIVGEAGNELQRAVGEMYLPNIITVFTETGSDELELLKNRSTVEGKPAAYVCENFACLRPVTTHEELRGILSE